MSSDQLLMLPPSRFESSETVSVQVPFGSSPVNAASGSSGTSGEASVRFAYVCSITRLLSAVYGTWVPGSASSSQTVPLKTSSKVEPLSVVRVTTVPAGEVIVTSRSDEKVC